MDDDEAGALGGYRLVSRDNKPLSLDPYEIRKEILADSDFMRELRTREENSAIGVYKGGPMVPYGGPDDKNPEWRGTEKEYRPFAPDMKNDEGDALRKMVIEEVMKRQARRAFVNKYGRQPNEAELRALQQALQKHPFDYGKYFEAPWKDQIEDGVETSPRKI